MAYFLFAEIGHLLSFRPSEFATFWPPSGLYLAVLARHRPSQWPALLAGALAANLFSDTLHEKSVLVSLAFWAANSLEALAGAWVLRRLFGAELALRTLREVHGFLLSALLTPTLGATLGAATAAQAFGTPFGRAWQIWWVADALGILIISPLLLSWAGVAALPRLRQIRFGRMAECAAALGLLTSVSLMVFSRDGLAPFTGFTYWTFPFLIWMAARFDLRGGSIASLIVSLVAVVSTTSGLGPFAEASPDVPDQALLLQSYLGITTLTTLHLAVSNAERDRYHRELQEKQRELENLATTDPLTSLKNRRVLEECLERELAFAARFGVSLSIAMLDIDQFKPYNDQWGHPEGDKVLKEVACLLADASRQVDLVARYGGDELVMVLPGTDQEGALRLAERIRQAVEEHPWPRVPVTVSLGVATCIPGDGASAEALLAQADAALYRAKRQGRNRIALAELRS